MLGLSDFLALQGQNPAARILKPWWDILADYLIRILLLISVVTGAVSLYVKDIACVPAITCPVAVTCPASRNPLVQNTCATFYNPNRCLENSSASEITVLITFESLCQLGVQKVRGDMVFDVLSIFNFLSSGCLSGSSQHLV